jgi:hypothetical protein
MDQTMPVGADVQLHAENQCLPYGVCFISGSRLALAFLVELGAAMMVASTIVPARAATAVAPPADSEPP